MNFPSDIFFDDINHGYRAVTLKKNSLWLLPLFMAVAAYSYYENEQCALQLYHSSLKF